MGSESTSPKTTQFTFEGNVFYDILLRTWGVIDNIDAAIEECSEFIVACMHVRRGRRSMERVMEEAADVYIMMQIISRINPKLFKEHVERKLRQATERLSRNEREWRDTVYKGESYGMGE